MKDNCCNISKRVPSYLAVVLAVALAATAHGQFNPAHIRAVDQNAPGPLHDGRTWQTAYLFLQDGLADAQGNPAITDIWVAAGTYTPPDGLDPPPADPREVSFELINGVSVLGGFAGGETQPDQADPAVNVTILSGDLNGDDGPNFENNAENSINVVMAEDVDSSAVLDGFTITAGNANDLPGGIAWGCRHPLP